MEQTTFLYRNSLSIVFLSLFVVTWLAQIWTGWNQHNEDLANAGARTILLSAYVRSGHFFSATFENFQSEFLQMALYVVLTVGLRQQGSAESKRLEGKEEVDREPMPSADAPWPVRRGGWILKLYSNSLSITFSALFFVSWALHFYGSWQEFNVEQALDGREKIDMISYLSEPVFWFETFQNWQSEFLSVASIVIFTIYLRQKGSPESKPVDAPHSETGK
ncbi:hypothetical protein B0I27_102370 [Arcticibacter pallidicorallinus]|uniref:Transmembrane protein n=1 Tax=Arcticibacter pallidicorallinus TaxID=1259464 RepID=A0A2T0U9I5_9SPHI|nr:DUF6766 family protein [Arcticibacter pallidicorallinus]PRY54601.1 hypothetical protein B0I27_102370 [Arcticibacter pallidicorallinus]